MKITSLISTKKPVFAVVGLFLLWGMTLCSCKEKSRYPGPLSPEESIKTFQFAEDFKAEIYATEPLIVDPVSMEFDEDGTAYVVSMLDAYKKEEERGKGKIFVLKDLDGDGKADTSYIFADSIREATSVLPWNGGILVAAAPTITFYKDTDGDGRADLKEVLFTGFFTKNEEAQITNLRFSVDNWIYANNTGQAGEITFTRKPDAPQVVLQGADFRFRLDRNLFERSTGPGQFGLAIDDWGHRYFTSNSIHIRQVVTPIRYVERNPYLPSSFKTAIHNISDHDPMMQQISETPYWRQVRTERRNAEYQEKKLDRVEYAREHFTGASGGTYYGGDALPQNYYGNVFTGEVAGNLVHRDILTPSDTNPYMIAKRGAAEKAKEFLASTDTWFRPTSLTSGPDGHLYLIDMYKQHIETPMSIPEDLQVDMDYHAGDKHGRIYRLVPVNAPAYKRVNRDLKNASPTDLLGYLSDPNQFWRLQAQRLLLERRDKTIIPAVKELFAQSRDARARLHSLYVLEGLDALNDDIIRKAMQDPEPGVRENAAILAERFAACLPDLMKLVNDPSVRVAYQAVLSIGEFRDKSVLPVFASVLQKHYASPWFRSAVLSSEAGSGTAMLKALSNERFFEDAKSGKSAFFEGLCNVIGARMDKSQMNELISFLEKSSPEIQKIGIVGLTKGLERSKDADDDYKEKVKSIGAMARKDAGTALRELKKIKI